MKTCETCKYWGAGEFAYESHFSNVTAKMCGKIKMRNETNSGDYSNDAYDPDLPVEYEYKVENGRVVEVKNIMHHKAYCQDGSSYRAELVTRPDFGCVLHEDS